eukprot:CAMPEP_0175828142 /NCGR_PEP_ID=MMETSP0107_2-20121207/12651_1 /TAXON_ID=195067 ORGANISM="Goniomonas pacifica, Strain CCMP1869" /NCGR_SAMPLE_ID=MMETSP0107_2 /ASSEMBLY_ACC=CAM_ASM_000203 /LENGTH=75 /DNA_ID=CAMNT_0017140849 /DNA_START=52 /DNA_END=276 /DNA_ORIENTATION=-
MTPVFDRIIPNLVLAWNLEEPSGQRAKDSAGSFVGEGVNTEIVEGRFGKGRELSGNGYLYAPSGKNPKWHGHFTA